MISHVVMDIVIVILIAIFIVIVIVTLTYMLEGIDNKGIIIFVILFLSFNLPL